jgi:hypothetical protein
MHRIASLGDMQESNKSQRHVSSHPVDDSDEQSAALVVGLCTLESS